MFSAHHPGKGRSLFSVELYEVVVGLRRLTQAAMQLA